MACFYTVMILILRLARIIFFRQVEVSGLEDVPGRGHAVIFAGNHPNGLIDPSLLLIYAGRKVRTMAKSTLFAGPLDFFFRGLGAIPVYRVIDVKPPKEEKAPVQAVDGGESGDAPTPPKISLAEKNTGAFREVNAVLAKGGAFSIFPEGISHNFPHLQELKAGLAHIALGFVVDTERETGVRPDLTIIPVGFTYTNPEEWRSRVWIKFGQGMTIPEPLVEMYTSDELQVRKQAARELTDIIAASLRRYTITAPDWETVELTILCSSLFRPFPHGGHASRQWACWCCTVADKYHIPVGSQVYLASIFRQESVVMLDDAVMNMLRLKVSEYNQLLKGLDYSDDDVRIHRDMGLPEVIASALFYFLVIFIVLPLSLPILVLNLPMIGIAACTGKIVSGGETDVVATLTVVMFSIILPFFYAAYVGILSWIFAAKFIPLMKADNYLSVGAWIVFFIIMIPMLSFITMRMWEEMSFAKDHCSRLYTLFTFKNRILEAKELRLVCHELVQATIVLLGNEELYAEAKEAFPDVTLMSRERAYRVVMDFAEANDIDEEESLLLAMANVGATHGSNSSEAMKAGADLQRYRSSFYADGSSQAQLIIDNTSLSQDTTARTLVSNRRAGSRVNSRANTPKEGTIAGDDQLALTSTQKFASGSFQRDPRRVNLQDTGAITMDGEGATEMDGGADGEEYQPMARRNNSSTLRKTCSGGGVSLSKSQKGSLGMFLEDTEEDRKRQDETAAKYGVFSHHHQYNRPVSAPPPAPPSRTNSSLGKSQKE